MATYPNGDQVGYVTVAYRCELEVEDLELLNLQQEEILEVAWFDTAEIATLDRHPWIDRVIADAQPEV